MVVAQICALAAQGFRKQKARNAGQRERGGMELVELHVGELGSGVRGQSNAIAGGYGGVGGVRVDLACAAGGDEDGTGGNAPGFAGMGLRIGADEIRSED